MQFNLDFLRYITYILNNFDVYNIGDNLSPEQPDAQDTYHYLRYHQHSVGAIVGLHYGIAHESFDDGGAWRKPTATDLRHLSRGALWGALAVIIYVESAIGLGLMRCPEAGWRRWSPQKLARSSADMGLLTLAVAWNEEVMFRGTGYTLLRRFLNPTLASIVSIVLFALWHGTGWLRVANYLVMATSFHLLRLETGNIWLSYGFHLGLGWAQKSLYSPVGMVPALRPVEMTGSEQWIGKLGTTKPGIFTFIWLCGVLVVLGIRFLHLRRAKHASS